MRPPIEEIAECAYLGFLQALGEHAPSYALPWNKLSPIVRHAWMEAAEATLAKVGNA
jgi:hypothetical protein